MSGWLFLVGGGPSLQGFDFVRLEHERAWAINSAFYDLPKAELVFWTDEPFYAHHHEWLMKHPGVKLASRKEGVRIRQHYPPEVGIMLISGVEGYDPRPWYVRSGNNSGYALLHRAIQLGEPRVALLGFDMYGITQTVKKGSRQETVTTQSNYHKRNGHVVQDTVYVRQMAHYFEGLVQPARERNVSIVNLSPQSRITCWPRMDFNTFLREHEPRAGVPA